MRRLCWFNGRAFVAGSVPHICWLLWFSAMAWGQNPQLIAPTDPLPPQEQREKFHLPPGFEIQLVVAEPHIGQPMNLNFDERGRLWITHSVEYPYPVAGEHVQPREERFGTPSEHTPRDRVTIVEGIDAHGQPAKVFDYLTELNIPIGVVPTPTGGIVYSIPNIDAVEPSATGEISRRKLFGPVGNVDTHGMVNGLTRWVDGWIYACHGFRNDSELTGSDGSTIRMNSGNTFRFREDGSHVEQRTWGQVNPFGLTVDGYGNMYTADCHSQPLTMLLPGAYYSSFGKPHDGLGYGPNMIDHSHGSTGICGPAYYSASHFPKEFQESLYLCNPVTGRVHRDQLIDHGATRLVSTQPDFITCDDPWFRPVDLQVGPDGALYLADFYNAIIGHYEVPLPHPKRDRTHGRVWRIVYRGDNAEPPHIAAPDLSSMDLPTLCTQLADDNLIVRTLATNALVDRFGQAAGKQLRTEIAAHPLATFRAHAAWVLFRTGEFDAEIRARLAQDSSPVVRGHLAQMLAELPDDQWSSETRRIAQQLLQDESGFVQRFAAEALARHPDISQVASLLSQLRQTSHEDTHLRHAIRIALKRQFEQAEILAALPFAELDEGAKREVASVLLAVPTMSAADRLETLITDASGTEAVQHVIRYGSAETLQGLAQKLKSSTAGQLQRQSELLLAIVQGLESRRTAPEGEIRAWAKELVLAHLQNVEHQFQWTELPYPGFPHKQAAFAPQSRTATDSVEGLYFSTLVTGEQRTGILRSERFQAPRQLSFFMAGHCGYPQDPCHGKNKVVLRDVHSRLVLKEEMAPRHDLARQFTWDLSEFEGRSVTLELHDGDGANAYAWIAVGRFSPDMFNPSRTDSAQLAIQLAQRFQLTELIDALQPRLEDPAASKSTQRAVAALILELRSDVPRAALLQLSNLPASQVSHTPQFFLNVVHSDVVEIQRLLAEEFKLLSEREQLPILETLLQDKAGAEVLLSLLQQGRVSPRHLRNAGVKQKLLAFRLPQAEETVAELTANLPPQNKLIEQAIRQRMAEFDAPNTDSMRGHAVFLKHCGVCHKLGTEGKIVGPQLDGIGRRGLERLLEDVLDPNRNVDAAFRTTTLVLTDGRVKSGLLRNTEGDVLTFADQKGETFTVREADIEERQISLLSLMPVNVVENLTAPEFNDLLAFLLNAQDPQPVTNR